MTKPIDRRSLLMASLLPASTVLSFETALGEELQAAPDPSLYIPKAHLVEERAFLHDFMEEYSFVMVVTPSPTLRITHIPSLLDRTRGRFGTILGHISAQNPQKAAFDGQHDAVIVFRGPHGYISAGWYASQTSVVPTWNFGVVHASGRPRSITDHDKAYDLLKTLISRNERRVGESRYDFSSQPKEYVDRMMQGISPFEMEIGALEGKFKLGQERSEGDRAGVVEHLKGAPYRERSLYDVTKAFYEKPPNRI